MGWNSIEEALMQSLYKIYRSFMQGWRDANPHCMSRNVTNTNDKNMRDNVSDHQYDRMLKETFPSSDPVAMY